MRSTRSLISLLSAFLLTLSSFSANSGPAFSVAGFSYRAAVATAQSGQVFERSGNLKQDVLDWIEYLPRDQNLYRIPTQPEINTWRQVMNAIQGGALATAASLVQAIAPSYKVIKFTDTSVVPARPYYLLLEADVTADDIFPFADTGWGAYIFDPQPVRDIAISVPHPKADAYTEAEGVEALVSLRARWLLLSGSHRCGSSTISPCTQGSSPSCSGGHRSSDGSHGANPSSPAVTNMFQVAHEELAKASTSTVVLQFHGNSSCSANFVISNGGNNYQIIPDGNVYRLKQSLGGVSSNIQVCDHNPGAGECDMCGTTNLQGRYINGSVSNPCQTSAPAPTTVERFIHLEQSLSMRQDALVRQRIIQAVANTTFVQQADPTWACSEGWYITGYFTPIETDYSGASETVFIDGVGSDTFNSAFLSDVRIEGWGKTRYGWYIGYYSSTWHKSNAPLDSADHPLVDGTIAVDPAVIGMGSSVKIPTLPSPWGSKIYTAQDVGGGIAGKHIDVYCGEGRVAEQETFRITGQNNQVCYK
jgi:3D (Asp-Asp-Asp) domain-containing protein